MDAAVGLGVPGGEGLPRIDDDELGTAGGLPLGESHRLGLVRVGAGDEDDLSRTVVRECRPERVDSRIAETRNVVSLGRSVVRRPVRRADRTEGQFACRIGVLEELVGVDLHAPRKFAVVIDHVAGDPGDEIECGVPWHRHEDTVDPEQGRGEAIRCRTVFAVQLLGQGAAPDRMPTTDVDDGGVRIREDNAVAAPAVDPNHRVHVLRDPPTGERSDR